MSGQDGFTVKSC